MCAFDLLLLRTCSVYSRLDCFITSHLSFSDVNIPWAELFDKRPLQRELTEGSETERQRENKCRRKKEDRWERIERTGECGRGRHWVRMKYSDWEVYWDLPCILVSQWERICLGWTGYRGVHLDIFSPNTDLSSCAVWGQRVLSARDGRLYNWNVTTSLTSSHTLLHLLINAEI